MAARRGTRPGTAGWSLSLAAVLAHVVMTVAAGAVPLGRNAAGIVICSAHGPRVLDVPPGGAGDPDRADHLTCYLCPACQTPTVAAGPPATAPVLARPLARPADIALRDVRTHPAPPAHRPGAPRGPPAAG